MSSNDVDHPFERLLELVETLRGPNGCPWDREQNSETLKPMLVEETFEVLEALDQKNPDELCEELGDLLFQIIFHSQIAKEKGEFDAKQVCLRLHEKMVGRHPHVFGEESFKDSQELLSNWERIKELEKKKNGGKVSPRKSLLDGIPPKLPSLYLANQLSSKAARVGFDWPTVERIIKTLLQEVNELKQARIKETQVQIKEELGDILFTVVNICRRLSIDPDSALNQANKKFSRRFREMEEFFVKKGRQLKDVDVREMENCWKNVKESENC